MICYFRKGLKPSIKVEMEQQDREPIDFEKDGTKSSQRGGQSGPTI